MNNLKSKVLSVIAWFFGITFILGGLGAFLGGSLIAGLLMLVAGFLFLPPIKRLILNKKSNLSKAKITLTGAVLAVISMFFVPTDAEIADGNQELTGESVEEKQQDVIAVEPITSVEKKSIETPKSIIEENEIAKPVEVVEGLTSTTEKRQDIDPVKARAILEKVDQEVREAKGFNLENSKAVAEKSRRMKALLEEETAAFGDENGEVSRLCDSTRRQAFTYWLQVFSERNKKDPQMTKDMLKYYQESKKPCLDAIKEFENS